MERACYKTHVRTHFCVGDSVRLSFWFPRSKASDAEEVLRLARADAHVLSAADDDLASAMRDPGAAWSVSDDGAGVFIYEGLPRQLWFSLE